MKFFCLTLFVLFSISVWGQTPDLQPEEKSETPTVEQAPAPQQEEALQTPHNISVGVSLQNYRYEEPGLISHTGILIGAWLNWFYKLKDYAPYYTGRVQTELNTGRIDYDGALCDINTNQCNEYKAKTNDLILRASHRFAFQVADGTELFAGLGYRYLFDKGEGSGFYRRIGQYLLLPMGFTTKIPWVELNTNVVVDIEYDFFLKGQMESKLSDVNTNFNDVKHTQNDGRALKVVLGFEPDPTPEDPHPWMFYFFYENWSIAQSDRVELLISGTPSGNFFYEPENRSNAYGLRVGWAY